MRTGKCPYCKRRYRLSESLGGVVRVHLGIKYPGEKQGRCPGGGLLPRQATIEAESDKEWLDRTIDFAIKAEAYRPSEPDAEPMGRGTKPYGSKNPSYPEGGGQ